MMHSLRSCLAFLLLSATGIPLAATAQPTHVGYRVSIPEGPITLQPLGGRASEKDTVHLMWDYGPRRLNPELPKGTAVTRTWTIMDDVEVTRPYTLTQDDSLDAEPSRARAYPGRRATIYVDEDDASRLHVNFWLPSSPSRWKGPPKR